MAILEIPAPVRQIASQLAQPQPMRRGSVAQRTLQCGKPNCACAQDPKARHGPYYNLTQTVNGKTRSRFLNSEQATMAQQQITAGREFREQLDTYWEACERWADKELEQAPAASPETVEKGGSARSFKSASPRKSKRS